MKLTRRHTAISAATLLIALVLGVGLGGLWYRLAPIELSVVLRDGTSAALPMESDHLFDALGLFALMGLGAGLVTGYALWQWRAARGPVMLLAAVAASLFSAWVAYRSGLLFAGKPDIGAPGTLVAVPPELGSAIVVVAQPLGAALAYGTAASLCGDHDLRRHNERCPHNDAHGELSCGAAAE